MISLETKLINQIWVVVVRAQIQIKITMIKTNLLIETPKSGLLLEIYDKKRI